MNVNFVSADEVKNVCKNIDKTKIRKEGMDRWIRN